MNTVYISPHADCTLESIAFHNFRCDICGALLVRRKHIGALAVQNPLSLSIYDHWNAILILSLSYLRKIFEPTKEPCRHQLQIIQRSKDKKQIVRKSGSLGRLPYLWMQGRRDVGAWNSCGPWCLGTWTTNRFWFLSLLTCYLLITSLVFQQLMWTIFNQEYY